MKLCCRTYHHYRLHGGVRSPVGYRVPALYLYRLPHFICTPTTYLCIFHSRILYIFSPALLHFTRGTNWLHTCSSVYAKLWAENAWTLSGVDDDDHRSVMSVVWCWMPRLITSLLQTTTCSLFDGCIDSIGLPIIALAAYRWMISVAVPSLDTINNVSWYATIANKVLGTSGSLDEPNRTKQGSRQSQEQ